MIKEEVNNLYICVPIWTVKLPTKSSSRGHWNAGLIMFNKRRNLRKINSNSEKLGK